MKHLIIKWSLILLMIVNGVTLLHRIFSEGSFTILQEVEFQNLLLLGLAHELNHYFDNNRGTKNAS